MALGICTTLLASLAACLLYASCCHLLLIIFRETHWPGFFSPPPARRIWDARISSHFRLCYWCVCSRVDVRGGAVACRFLRIALSMPTLEEKAEFGQHFLPAGSIAKQTDSITRNSGPSPPCPKSIMAANALNGIYRWAIPTAAAFSLASASIYDVKGGTRAVIFDRMRGVSDQVVNEGTHFLVPWLQKAITFDVRTKPRNISTTTGSKDLQMVSLTLRVLHRPEVQQLPKIYQNLGQDYDERVLPSIGNEVLKAIVAQFDAAELITQREAVSNRIRAELLKRASEFNIALEDVSITHMTFGREFTKAVEEKQIAQQEAERARFIVEKAEQERQANVIRAEGESEAAEVISKAVAKSGDGLIQIRRIETQKDVAQMLANNPNVTYLPGGQGQDGGKGGNFLLGLRS
ncbi:Prohibitin-1 [Cercospora zeina]